MSNNQPPKSPWRRILLISGSICMLTIGGLFLYLNALFPSADDLCANDQVVEQFSPNGQLKAVTFRRNCGATTDLSTHVSIFPSSSKLPNLGGNVFVQNQEPLVTIHWLDDQHLNISGGDASTAFLHLSELRGVHLTYD